MIPSGRRKGAWYEVRVPPSWAAEGLGKVLARLPIPPKVCSSLIRRGGVRLQGQTLHLRLFPPEEPGVDADFAELNILYEDDFSLVVHKPAGIEAHPSVAGQRGTLAHAVAAYYACTDQKCRVRPIHRLDKETSGPVLFAKNEFAHAVFDRAMREKRIGREYVAVVEGVVKNDEGTIDLPISQHRHHPTKRRISPTGERAVTHYRVMERFDDHTLLWLKLETGRTHQIRVHLSSIGHPIAGDGLYGGSRRLIRRQALHGEKLVWFHPWTQTRLQVRAPLPDDMRSLLETLISRRESGRCTDESRG